MEAQSEYAHVACNVFFCTFSADLHAQSVLIDKISASELSLNFIKSCALGWVCTAARKVIKGWVGGVR